MGTRRMVQPEHAETGTIPESEYQSEILENLSQLRNYRDWLCSMAQPYLGERPLELGSGNGDYAEHLLARGLPRITLSEIDPNRFAEISQRFAHDGRVDFAEIDLAQPARADHSAMLSFNVLEHIEDDVAALRAARTLVRPGGHVFHLTPAFPIGISEFDRRVGHFRRYRRRVLIERAEQAGLIVDHVRYVNAPGLIAWVILMRLLKGQPQAGRMLALWDGWVIPIVRRVESRIRPPFGQSIVLVARTPG